MKAAPPVPPRQLQLPAGLSPAAGMKQCSNRWCRTAFLLSPWCLYRPVMMPRAGCLLQLEYVFSSCCTVSWIAGGLLPSSCCSLNHLSLLLLSALTLFSFSFFLLCYFCPPHWAILIMKRQFKCKFQRQSRALSLADVVRTILGINIGWGTEIEISPVEKDVRVLVGKKINIS